MGHLFRQLCVGVLIFTAAGGSAVQAAPSGSLAYIGPGAGLGMIGSLIAVLCVVALALVAPMIFVIRLMIGFYKRMSGKNPPTDVSSSEIEAK